MTEYTSYVVRQGDHLEKLGHLLGFDAAKVWSDPKNADLKALRGDGSILQTGDVVYLRAEPARRLPIQKGTTNRYVAKVPRIQTHIKLADEKGPYANEPFVIDGAGDHVEGTSDGEGSVVFEHRVTTRVVTLTLPKRGRCTTLRVGDMDPLTEIDDTTRRAVAVFQEKHGLPVTGDLDDATRDAIKSAHGC